MPPKLRKRGSEWCVEEPGGKKLGCHSTRHEALAQIAAIEANKAIDINSKAMIVDSDGLRYMLLITSNSYRDREGDIIRSDALKEYAEGKTKTKPEDNVLLFWHDGDPIGDIVYAEFYKSFLIEVARERENEPINIGSKDKPIHTSIKQVWDVMEATPGKWAASHGFYAIDKSSDGVIYPIDKKESSVVLADFQANWWTLSEVL